MADITNEIFTFGEDRGEGGGGWLTISSWSELCRTEKPYSVFWRSEEDQAEAAREAAAAKREAINHKLYVSESEDEEDVAIKNKKETQSEDVKRISNVEDHSADNSSASEEEDLEDVNGGVLSSAYALLNGPSNLQNRRAQRTRNFRGRHQSQFRILLVCPPDDCNKIQLVPIPGTGQYYIDINTELEDTVPDFTAHSGTAVCTVRTILDAYPIAKQFLWSAMGRIKARISMAPPDKKSVNIRHRIRLGRKTLHCSLLDDFTPPEDITTAYQVCGIFNENVNRGTAFIDSVTVSEYNRIAGQLERFEVTSSEVLQLHINVRGQGYRITCVNSEEGLQVVKVKDRSMKHAVVDMIIPGGYDLRYDIRTTDNVPQDSASYGIACQICSQIIFDKEALTFHVRSDAEFPQQTSFRLSAIRLKRKKQYHTPGVSDEVGYRVKVSMSKTHQFEVSFSNSPSRPFQAGDISHSASARYEIGAQLLTSKHIFDGIKSNPLLSTGDILASCHNMLPNSLYAMRQMPRLDALKLQMAINQSNMPAEPIQNDESSVEDDKDDNDDEV